MKINSPPYYGFDHKLVKKKFEGNPVFCNEFTVNDEYLPVAVYKVDKPNRTKGHKDYILLQVLPEGGYVRGMDASEMEKWKFQQAIYCSNCEEVIYSKFRHDYHSCSCGDCTVDGGRSYLKYSFTDANKCYVLTINLLTNEVVNGDSSNI